eukprot:Hpha_TRINITY_DN15697_c1_g1::TRINITY_DN15697_c1_g1_i9::g.98868::m.98868
MAHLDSIFGIPSKDTYYAETYCRQWFTGLFAYVLDIENWHVFFEAFLRHGFHYLIACGLSVVKCLKDDIIASKDPGVILKLLRLDGISSADGGAMITWGGMGYLPVVKKILGTRMEQKQLRVELYKRHLSKQLEKDEESSNEEDKEGCQWHTTDPETKKPCGNAAVWEIEAEDKRDPLDGVLVCNVCAAHVRGVKLVEW